MKSIIIFVHSESTPSSVPKLSLCFSSSASSQPPCHLLSFGSFLSSFFTPKNSKFLSFQFKDPNPKIQSGVKMHLSTHLGAMGVQENSRKMKWSLDGDSKYLKIKTLTSKCILDSHNRVQDSSINKKKHQTSLLDH